ncbi:MAG: DNA topoisomerase I [Acidilobaceae archaeon]
MSKLAKLRHCELPTNFIAIIAEKPKAAQRIANAIGKADLCVSEGTPYWIIRSSNTPIVVVSAAGHLFGLYTPIRDKYPVYDFEWRPLWVIDESSRHLKRFYDLLARILPKASLYVSACDYDVEGSVICYKIIEAFGDPRRARRMKFSTLTATEIRESFKRLQPLDVEMIEAGLARHELDWLWGINVSRALMDALRTVTGSRRVLSAGRVQSPTLLEAARRWVSKALHVPKPHIELTVIAETRDGRTLSFKPKEWSPATLSEAKSIAVELKKRGTLLVVGSEKHEKVLDPPPAFNLGDLQHEAYRVYGFSPMKTQNIAEELYLKALISYPRTNSQKLPATIDFYRIMSGLKSNPKYSKLVTTLLSESRGVLKPVQGREEDPAHPAIHPTGESPVKLSRDQELIYDLIVRRFLAAFAKPAVLNYVWVVARDYSRRLYVAHGIEVAEKGWLKYYHFSEPQEHLVPSLRSGDELRVASVRVGVRWSSSPIAITKDSLLRWMESVGLGTESTRARIIETLYEREYIVSRGKTAVVSDLGLTIASILDEYVPELTSPDLTRRFERLLEDIRYGRTSRLQVIKEAIASLNVILEKISRNKAAIGFQIAQGVELAKPSEKCSICDRQASRTMGEVKLCRYHEMSVDELKKAIPEIARKLDTTCRKALETVAGKRATGVWVAETARFALRDSRLLDLITSLCRE